jgi:hypothetical protein
VARDISCPGLRFIVKSETEALDPVVQTVSEVVGYFLTGIFGEILCPKENNPRNRLRMMMAMP